MEYDIFISYRRDGGEQTARMIHDTLTAMGYRVFFDVESLRSGEFNRELFRVISSCKDFLVVLSPNALDRCSDPNDWVLQEISCAMDNNKNIIPVLLRGFSFPNELPQSIDSLRWKNGLEPSITFYDAFIEKLTTFLVTKPSVTGRLKKIKLVPIILVLLCLILVGGGIWFCTSRILSQSVNTMTQSFPSNATEQELVDEAVYYVMSNLALTDAAIGSYDAAITSCNSYINDMTGTTISDTKYQLSVALLEIENSIDHLAPLSDYLSQQIGDSPFSHTLFVALYDGQTRSLEDMHSSILMVDHLISDKTLTASTISSYCDELLKLSNIEKNIFFYSFNEALLPVNEDTVISLKQDSLPMLPHIYSGQTWSNTEADLEGLYTLAGNQYEECLTNLASLVGNEQSTLDQMNLTEKAKMEEDLEFVNKNKPSSADDVDLLWGKMLRFKKMGILDVASECLSFYLLASDDPKSAEVYVTPTLLFINNMELIGIDGGAVIIDFEPNLTIPADLQIGDIIYAINGIRGNTNDELFQSVDGDYTASILRIENGTYQTFDTVVHEGEARMLLRDLSETE